MPASSFSLSPIFSLNSATLAFQSSRNFASSACLLSAAAVSLSESFQMCTSSVMTVGAIADSCS